MPPCHRPDYTAQSGEARPSSCYDPCGSSFCSSLARSAPQPARRCASARRPLPPEPRPKCGGGHRKVGRLRPKMRRSPAPESLPQEQTSTGIGRAMGAGHALLPAPSSRTLPSRPRFLMSRLLIPLRPSGHTAAPAPCPAGQGNHAHRTTTDQLRLKHEKVYG
jgi:hypothetical protein